VRNAGGDEEVFSRFIFSGAPLHMQDDHHGAHRKDDADENRALNVTQSDPQRCLQDRTTPIINLLLSVL